MTALRRLRGRLARDRRRVRRLEREIRELREANRELLVERDAAGHVLEAVLLAHATRRSA